VPAVIGPLAPSRQPRRRRITPNANTNTTTMISTHNHVDMAASLVGAGAVQADATAGHPSKHGFVDAPREAVAQAEGLVPGLMQHLPKTFADERGRLEGQWDRGDDVSTEDLRTAFQRYRLFFERLLTT
jgi:hypothetical protein